MIESILFKQRVKRVMIVGGGEMTHYLCNLLTKTGISVKVIEKNKARIFKGLIAVSEIKELAIF